ncbi:MAG: phage terminase large subunit [Alphaproteobacteria bacterium]|nr:phage terminase large subunit [Rhodospirillales bacterium]MCW9045031.1 phage terminase large subunit [Alphaproteobacteria bacterium]
MQMDFPEFVWIWMEKQNLSMPNIHLRFSRWLAESWHGGERQLLMLAFRNSGKSTLVGLFCAWRLLQDPSTRILILAADYSLAKKMVRNVKRVIERHPLTAHLKPSRRDQWAADQFTVNRTSELRDPSMLAKGISANITGSRADIVICDDVEVPNTCDTPGKRSDLREKLSEIDYVLVPGGMQLYVGTPHTFYSLYAEETRLETGEEVPFLDGFKRLEIPVLDSHGKPAWPERFPLTKIKAMRRRSGAAKHDSQMMLKPTNITDGRLDPSLFIPYALELDYRVGNGETVLNIGDKKMVSASCWWDPSFGSPEKGDSSVIAAVFSDDEGHYYLHRVSYLTHDPKVTDEVDEATQLCRQAVVFLKTNHLPSVTIETNGIGKFLPGLLRRELKKVGVSCAVVEKNSHRNKAERILDAFDARLAAGVISAHKTVLANSFIEEMREWRPDGGGNDDGLDAVAGCLLAEPVRISRVPNSTIQKQNHSNWRFPEEGYVVSTEFPL